MIINLQTVKIQDILFVKIREAIPQQVGWDLPHDCIIIVSEYCMYTFITLNVIEWVANVRETIDDCHAMW